jgi:hypothetical protein
VNFKIGCVALAREECARCGQPWLHPEWTLMHSYPVAYIKPHEDDLAEVWCDKCVQHTSPGTWELVKADRERFYADAPPDVLRPPADP